MHLVLEVLHLEQTPLVPLVQILGVGLEDLVLVVCALHHLDVLGNESLVLVLLNLPLHFLIVEVKFGQLHFVHGLLPPTVAEVLVTQELRESIVYSDSGYSQDLGNFRGSLETPDEWTSLYNHLIELELVVLEVVLEIGTCSSRLLIAQLGEAGINLVSVSHSLDVVCSLAVSNVGDEVLPPV